MPTSDGESKFYFGLAASGPTDERAVIPFMTTDQEAFLEYDVTKLIHQVAWPKKPVVGMIDTLNLDAPNGADIMQPSNASPVALKQMRQSFDVHVLDKTVDRIPEDVDVLLLIQPLALSDSTCYAIDQFVLHGGRVLAFMDPMPESSSNGPAFSGAGFSKLLTAWGVKFDSSKVVGDLQLARTVQYQRDGHVDAAQYPAWITITQEQLNNTDVVTANLGSLNLASAGAIFQADGAKIQFTPLVHSTQDAALLDSIRLGMGVDLQALLRDFNPTGKIYTLAARITGKVKTAFPDGAPKAAATDGKDANKPAPPPLPVQLKESKQPVNLILIADTDLLQDKFWVQVQNLMGIKLASPSAANGSLLVNALDNLSGDNNLISVRNRGQFSRPFTRINELHQAAERNDLAKEKELVEKLTQTKQRLNALEQGKGNTAMNGGSEGLVLSAAQQQELENFRQEKLSIRKDLRNIRHQLGQDIDSLETWIKVINLGLIPLLIAVIGIWLGLRRTRRRYDAPCTPIPTKQRLANA